MSATALAVGLLLPIGAQAQSISAESAQVLQDQIRAWLGNLIGPDNGQAALTPKVEAQDDHYRLTMRIPGAADDVAATADLRPLDQGRWRLDALHVPPTMQFSLHVPEPGQTPAAPLTAFNVSIGEQDANALIAPNLDSRSDFTIRLKNVMLQSDSPTQHQEQRIDQYLGFRYAAAESQWRAGFQSGSGHHRLGDGIPHQGQAGNRFWRRPHAHDGSGHRAGS